MARICPLFSGSSGNSYFVGSADAGILIDIGRSAKQIQEMLSACDIPIGAIKAIFLTHEHTDHIKGLRVFTSKYKIPVFLYECAATRGERENLATVRKGEFEGLDKKLEDTNWTPDYGVNKKHKTAGAIAIGARRPLIAYNINLDTTNIDIASKIAKTIRHSNGGYRYIKAGPVEVPEKNMTQVTMNLTDYTKTSMYRAFEAVKMEAKRYGVNIIGSEIVGLCPMEALVDVASYYLGLENFTLDKVLEISLME